MDRARPDSGDWFSGEQDAVSKTAKESPQTDASADQEFCNVLFGSRLQGPASYRSPIFGRRAESSSRHAELPELFVEEGSVHLPP